MEWQPQVQQQHQDEVKPKKTTTQTTTPKAGATPAKTTRKPGVAYESEFEAALAGLDIFTGYHSPGAGKQGPIGGAKYKPATSLFTGWFRHSDTWIRKTQRQMWEAGLYGDMKWEEVNKGAKDDPDTLAAYTLLLKAVGMRNKFGDDITKEAWLDERAKYLAENGLTPGGTGDERGPNIIQLSSSADLKAVADDISTQVMGMGFTPAEVAQFIAAQHADETAAQTRAYDLAGGSGGSVERPTDPSVTARNLAEKLHPEDFKARQMADLSEAFLASIRGETQADREF